MLIGMWTLRAQVSTVGRVAGSLTHKAWMTSCWEVLLAVSHARGQRCCAKKFARWTSQRFVQLLVGTLVVIVKMWPTCASSVSSGGNFCHQHHQLSLGERKIPTRENLLMLEQCNDLGELRVCILAEMSETCNTQVTCNHIFIYFCVFLHPWKNVM